MPALTPIQSYLVGYVIFCPLAALFAKVCAPLLGASKLRYLTLLTSTLVGYTAVIAAGYFASPLIFRFEAEVTVLVRLAMGLTCLALAHAFLLRTEKKRLGLWKGSLVASTQIILSLVLVVGLLFAIDAFKE